MSGNCFDFRGIEELCPICFRDLYLVWLPGAAACQALHHGGLVVVLPQQLTAVQCRADGKRYQWLTCGLEAAPAAVWPPGPSRAARAAWQRPAG